MLLLTLFACAFNAPDSADSTLEGADPGDCSDRVDNDDDGFIDCGDPGCDGSPDCLDTG